MIIQPYIYNLIMNHYKKNNNLIKFYFYYILYNYKYLKF